MKFTPEVVAALEVLRAAAENDFERHRLDALERDLHEPPKVEIIDETHQKFDGVTYRETKKDAHYIGSVKLHRVVWEYFFGIIPEGYVIHHVDCNPANNSPDNLQCLSRIEHAKVHSEIAGTVPPPHKKIVMTCINCGRTFTIHERSNNGYCSSSCRMAHRFKNLRETRVCQRCGKEFDTYKYGTAKFCSKECRYFSEKRVKKICPVCGKEFETVSSKESSCCSHKCATTLMWQKKKSDQQQN